MRNKKVVITIPQFTYVKGRKGRSKGSANPDRDAKIISMVSRGEITQKVGDMFGITRERVRQIYLKYTGRPAKERMVKRLFEEEERLNKVSFRCLLCGREVTVREGRNRQHYCSDCVPFSSRGQKRIHARVKCTGCGTRFTPTRNQMVGFTRRDPRYKGHLYHNRKCFLKNQSKVRLYK